MRDISWPILAGRLVRGMIEHTRPRHGGRLAGAAGPERRRLLMALVLATGLAPAAVATQAVHAAASAATNSTVTYTQQSSFACYTVPANVYLVHVALIGGHGSAGISTTLGSGGSGGRGAEVSADLPVQPGESLGAVVAENGLDPTTALGQQPWSNQTGGGAAGIPQAGEQSFGGQGGGESQIVQGCDGQGATQAVAGGGGGGGGAGSGPDGGQGGDSSCSVDVGGRWTPPFQFAPPGCSYPPQAMGIDGHGDPQIFFFPGGGGGGATTSAGGPGGGGDNTHGRDGSAYQGGGGGARTGPVYGSSYFDGGGGGGYYGGGGGGEGGGGGGGGGGAGSNYVVAGGYMESMAPTSSSPMVSITPVSSPPASLYTVAAGDNFTCALTANQTVACWGANSAGQATPPSGTFTSLSAGSNFACGLRTDRTIACWGDNTYSQTLAPPGQFHQVSVGDGFACGLRLNATISCWGLADFSHAGLYAAISSGSNYLCAIQYDQHAVCWGATTLVSSTTPAGDQFTQISAGLYAPCGILTDGTSVCWGGSYAPTPPSGTFSGLSSASYSGNMCWIGTDGTLQCATSAYGTQLPATPTGAFSAVSMGYAHACAAPTTGGVVCWGDDSAGETYPLITAAWPDPHAAVPPAAPLGQPYSFAITTTYESPAATFSLTGGSLPPGLTLSSSGVLAGTPTTAGVYNFTISAGDGAAPVATLTTHLLVPQAPAITSASGATFVASRTNSFTVTTTGAPVPQPIAESGALPSGVTFADNGDGTATLNGAPAIGSQGVYPLTITAQNGQSPDATQSFTLTVAPPTLSGPPATWTQVSTTGPSARSNPAMAYDPATKQLLLFGGSTGASFLGDTWSWDGSAWQQLSPAASPPARGYASLAYDPATKQLLLFGGSSSGNNGNWLNDTWSWDGSAWRQLSPAASPPARSYASLAYNPATGKLLLFGGYGPNNPTTNSQLLGDTWSWDGSAWQQLSPTASPSARLEASMALDPATNQLILFGGSEGSTSNDLGDTWTWTGSAWQQLNPAASPPARQSAAVADDAATGQLLLFGGCCASNGISGLGDTWSWDGTSQTWQQRYPLVGPPRDSAGLAFDQATGQMILFGGDNGGGGRYDDTWAYTVPQPTGLVSVAGSGAYGGSATLTATLSSGTTALSGQTITFLLNGKPIGSAQTDNTGVATLANVSLAEINAGSFPAAVGASFAGDNAYSGSGATGALTVAKANQTITASTPAPADALYGATFAVSATAGSGLAVSYGSSGACVNAGATVTMTGGTGTCTVTFDRAGNGNYNAAAEVSETVAARQAPATILLTSAQNPAVSTYGQAVSFTATAATASGGGTPTGSVQFQVDGVNLGSPVVLSGGMAASISTALLSAGPHTVAASYSGDGNFAGGAHTSLTQSVGPAPLTVTANDAARPYGAANPAFSVSYQGLVNSDSARSLGGTLVVTTSATASSPAGTYPITPSGLTAPNYAITYQPGTLTVTNPAPTTTKLSPPGVQAGSGALALTITGANFVPRSTVLVTTTGGSTTTLTPSAVSSDGTQLTVTIPAVAIATVWTLQVAVVNAAPGGGASNPQPLFVTAAHAAVSSESVSITGTATTGGAGPNSAGSVTVSGSGGNGTVAVAIYATNPGGTPSFAASGGYVDAYVAPGSTYSSVRIVDCALHGGSLAYWYNASTATWTPASNQSYDPVALCTTITVTASSTPSLAQLGGTPFGIANVPPVMAAPGPQNAQYGRTLSFTVTASDVEPSDVVSLTASGLPAGLSIGPTTFNQATRQWTATVSGTVSALAGTYPVSITANDGYSTSAAQTVPVTVKLFATGSLLALNQDGASCHLLLNGGATVSAAGTATVNGTSASALCLNSATLSASTIVA